MAMALFSQVLLFSSFFLFISLIVLVLWVFYRLFTAKVESFDTKELNSSDMCRDAILAASFNPIHLGHIKLLEAISSRHPQGTVFAIVGHNPYKKYRVSPEERCNLLRVAVRANPLLRNVVPIVVEGYVWRFAFRQDFSRGIRNHGCLFYRGIRTWKSDGRAEQWFVLFLILL